MLDRVAWLLATWFGCGLAPKAPGTAGSLGGLAAAGAAAYWLGWNRAHLMAAPILLTAPAVWAATRVAEMTNDDDPSIVVVDEVLGQWVALWGALHLTPFSVALAFGLFRLFDIWKPFPVRQLEQLAGGVGIVADDLAAGVWATLVMLAAGWFNLY
ncbi:MAG: phosphatidylglycerophosphatase A [Acidobacteria bacterium]|nr:phosphatidylglycerophosphatase A [Acidobacteriota bacterium]